MKFYVDDVMVKEQRVVDHIAYLLKSFDILKRYKMKLSLKKCVFGVTLGKFLRFMVNQCSIKVNPNKIKMILEMNSLRSIKDV